MATTLKVEKRELRPRSIRKKLRAEGRVPAVVYGNDVENTAISVDAHQLMKALKASGQNAVYMLDIDGKKVPTLLYDQQTDTFTREWLHVEFIAVDMSEETEVEAEISLVGTAKGAKAGGVLGQNLYAVMVSATPDKLPDVIEVDVTDLGIGDAITIGDLPKNADYTIITDAEEQVASVEAAVDHEEAEDAAAAAATVAEPEVIGEKEAE